LVAAVAGAVVVGDGLGEALALAEGLTAGVAVESPAACCSDVCCVPPSKASVTPSVRPSAIGMASGTARRAARLRGRRHADRRPVGM
jgi:hypothetical protein